MFHRKLDALICICLIIRPKMIGFVVDEMESAVCLKYQVNKSN